MSGLPHIVPPGKLVDVPLQVFRADLVETYPLCARLRHRPEGLDLVGVHHAPDILSNAVIDGFMVEAVAQPFIGAGTRPVKHLGTRAQCARERSLGGWERPYSRPRGRSRAWWSGPWTRPRRLYQPLHVPSGPGAWTWACSLAPTAHIGLICLYGAGEYGHRARKP